MNRRKYLRYVEAIEKEVWDMGGGTVLGAFTYLIDKYGTMQTAFASQDPLEKTEAVLHIRRGLEGMVYRQRDYRDEILDLALKEGGNSANLALRWVQDVLMENNSLGDYIRPREETPLEAELIKEGADEARDWLEHVAEQIGGDFPLRPDPAEATRRDVADDRLAALNSFDREVFQRQMQLSRTKRCPFCAERIKLDALVCRYCGRELP